MSLSQGWFIFFLIALLAFWVQMLHSRLYRTEKRITKLLDMMYEISADVERLD